MNQKQREHWLLVLSYIQAANNDDDLNQAIEIVLQYIEKEQREWYQKGIESIKSRCPYCGGSLGKLADGRNWARTCMSEKCLAKQKTEAGRRSAAKGGNYRKW